ncbi:MAG: aldehyde dehydrogenase family protein [Gammaproteobacteria bacterium]|nr:MAG: aldehyde dehydrogenase family protein [Gammaproteobacteria bacterium]
MYDFRKFYINGEWVDPFAANDFDVINPTTERPIGSISLGGAADVDRAVAAARAAFPAYAATSRDARIELLLRIKDAYKRRYDDIARAITDEMGAPVSFATKAQTSLGLSHLTEILKVLKAFEFTADRGDMRLVREPVGVCALITPWTWPMNQIAVNVAPALAAGCTIVLKPSEIAPLSSVIYAEVMADAGVPPGVFNLVNGDGPTVGQALCAHPEVDMVSFTGSTRGGIAVAKTAADTVKRVHQELGGKSANIILDDAVLDKAVAGGVAECFINAGQSCNAPTRMLVPRECHARAVEIACRAAARVVQGDPLDAATTMGPVVSDVQYARIQHLIQSGIDEGAEIVVGGTGRPAGIDTGYFVRPTIFANVSNDMEIAQQEIFGPVLVMIPFVDEADAVRIANDSSYGLSAYVSASDPDAARRVAGRLRTGMVHLNGAHMRLDLPFGGYKQSGNGREWGAFGFEAYLETKAVLGYGG